LAFTFLPSSASFTSISTALSFPLATVSMINTNTLLGRVSNLSKKLLLFYSPNCDIVFHENVSCHIDIAISSHLILIDAFCSSCLCIIWFELHNGRIRARH
jgi:hypothetical protein